MFRRQYMRYDSDVDGYESPIEVVTASGDGTDDAATPGATPVGVANQSVLILEKSGTPNTQSTADIEEASLPFDLAKKRTLGFCLWCRSKQQAKFALTAVFILFAFTAGLLIGGYLLFQSEALPFFSKADDPLPPLPPLPPKNVNVGVYYYPWHSDDFHRGQGYMREKLDSAHVPLLGEYDDSDPKTIAQHLEWSRQANIKLWVTSWWGKNTREDKTTKKEILKHPDLGDHRIALFYETTGRIKKAENYTTHRVVPDIEYICESYFNHPNYLRIDGRPVLFVYLTRKLETLGIMEDVIALMRYAAQKSGYDIFIVGDHVFSTAPDEEYYPPFTVLDAVTNYDVYGSMGVKGGYAGMEGVIRHYQKQREWREHALDHGCAFLPSASPGYNDLGVRPEKKHFPLSRRLTANDKSGSLFQAVLREARYLVDSSVQNLLIVNSFNEWHEDTQIEPVVGTTTSSPFNFTYGLEYEGYGELYLNILRQETED